MSSLYLNMGVGAINSNTLSLGPPFLINLYLPLADSIGAGDEALA